MRIELWRSAFLKALAVCLAATVASCGQKKNDVEAEPLAPPPYGLEEESNVELWLETMELSNRELYAARDAVVADLGLKQGDSVADLGAGTGLYSLLFAPLVGEAGVVYAIDIEPLFLKLINQRAADLDIANVVAVLNREDDIVLPAGTLDAVFIADTYHWFADPAPMMESVKRALKPEGRLFILDHQLDEAAKQDPALVHVRFGKAGLIAELEGYGFALDREANIDGLADFYMLQFSPSGGQ